MPDVVVSSHINDLLRSQSSSGSRSILGMSLVDNLSSNWQNTYTTVQSYSAGWGSGSGGSVNISSLSSKWELGYSGYVSLTSLSSNWQSAYTTVQAYSAGWGSGSGGSVNLTSKADLSGAQFTGAVTATSLSATGNLTIRGITTLSADVILGKAPIFTTTEVKDLFILNSLGATSELVGGSLVSRAGGGYSIFSSVISQVGTESANYNHNQITQTIEGEPTVFYSYYFPLVNGTLALDSTAVMLSGNQTINGNKRFTEPVSAPTLSATSLSATTIFLGGGHDSFQFRLAKGGGLASYGIINHNALSGNDLVAFGDSACLSAGYSGIASGIIAMGKNSARLAGSSGGEARLIMSFGNSTCRNAAISGGKVVGAIAMGSATMEESGSQNGDVIDAIAIGNSALYKSAIRGYNNSIIAMGTLAGQNLATRGRATDIIAIGRDSVASAAISGNLQNAIHIGDNSGRNLAFKGDVKNSTGIGAFSLYMNPTYTTGSFIDNATAIGLYAGSSMTQGINLSSGYAKNTISIGTESGLGIAADEGYAEEIISIGTVSGYGAGYNNGNAVDIVAIGNSAAAGVGYAGIANDVISIGRYAGYYAGSTNIDTSLSGSAIDIIAIGNAAGFNSGSGGDVRNSIYIGLSSGINQKSSRNTFIGDLTNTNNPSSPTLSGCIAIGYGSAPSARNTIAIGSQSTPLSVVPGGSLTTSLSGLKIMINGRYYTIPLLS